MSSTDRKGQRNQPGRDGLITLYKHMKARYGRILSLTYGSGDGPNGACVPEKVRTDEGLETKSHAGRYMPGLDGLRALAVLAVIAYHFNLKWAPGGLLGVCLFFVLSGYLITDLLAAQWSAAGYIDLKEFWLRRARRLLPALFAMLAGVAVWTAVVAPHRLPTLGEDTLAALLYSSNWWFIFHQVSYFASFGPPSPLGHLWSLRQKEIWGSV